MDENVKMEESKEAMQQSEDDKQWESTAKLTLNFLKCHVIAVLSTALSCPLVGNHYLISLVLARLLVQCDWFFTCEDDSLTDEKRMKSIQNALCVCWDGIDKAHARLLTPRFSLNRPTDRKFFVLTNDNPSYALLPKVSESITSEGLEESFGVVMALLKRLGPVGSRHKFVDKQSVLPLCMELNRLSRMAEKSNTVPSLNVWK